jgi:hypothetical protein
MVENLLHGSFQAIAKMNELNDNWQCCIHLNRMASSNSEIDHH